MAQTDVSDKYRAGNLGGAIESALACVKAAPTDTTARGFLCELLAFAGAFERADRHLDLISDQDKQIATGIALFRQILRGAMARREVFAQGRAPDLLDSPPDHLQLALRALAAERDGATAEAADLVRQAEDARPVLTGVRGNTPFDQWRDLDDITAGVLETITSTGKYYWVPLERIATLRFETPKRPRDLLWRKAYVDVRSGPEGVVYVPVIYPTLAGGDDDAFNLGRATSWTETPDAPVRGLGQRTFLFGETDVPILDVEAVTMDAPTSRKEADVLS